MKILTMVSVKFNIILTTYVQLFICIYEKGGRDFLAECSLEL